MTCDLARSKRFRTRARVHWHSTVGKMQFEKLRKCGFYKLPAARSASEWQKQKQHVYRRHISNDEPKNRVHKIRRGTNKRCVCVHQTTQHAHTLYVYFTQIYVIDSNPVQRARQVKGLHRGTRKSAIFEPRASRVTCIYLDARAPRECA